MLLLGERKPLLHQAEDVDRLASHPRINVWNGLGTGKTCTVAWWLQRAWLSGAVDEAVVILPSMCFSDWCDTFTHLAWPDGLAEVFDCRPPDQHLITSMLASGLRSPVGVFRVFVTTYSGLRTIFTEKVRRTWTGSLDSPLAAGLRGRRTAVVFDEAQAAALDGSGQGEACRAIASCVRSVASMTATPIGNPLHLRVWGLASLTRPDLLGPEADFDLFKSKYAILHDPVLAARGGHGRPVAARSYPVAVHDGLIRDDVLAPLAPFTARRAKEDCLTLPPKIRMKRTFTLPPHAQRAMDDLIEEGRAVLEDGSAVVPSNVLEERLRVLELSDGWLEGRPVHHAKLELLLEVYREFTDAEGERAPFLVWGSRSRGILASALVLGGCKPSEALRTASEAFIDSMPGPIYFRKISELRKLGVGVIHGPTVERDRDSIQADWKAGHIRAVCAHPGVAGAGLNWQHVRGTAYFSQPLGSIARAQSEDRVHRFGLTHAAPYFDLVSDDGPDEAVARAHTSQRDAEAALLAWLVGRSRGQ